MDIFLLGGILLAVMLIAGGVSIWKIADNYQAPSSDN